MRLPSFLKKGPYWLRGVKYGIAIFGLILTFFFPPLWILLIITTVPLLSLFENIFGGIEFVTELSGGLFAFGLVFPNIYGLLLILILLVVLGSAIGFIVGSVKNVNTPFRILKIIIPIIVIYLFVYFISFANTSPSVTRCKVVFDGHRANNRSDCYFHVMKKNKELATLDFCKHNVSQYNYAECLRIVADYTTNIEICDLIPDGNNSELGQYCYFSVAKRLNNPSLCEAASLRDSRIKCYMKEAETKAGCGEFSYQPNRNLCNLELIKKMSDPFFCRFVGGADKALCIDFYHERYSN